MSELKELRAKLEALMPDMDLQVIDNWIDRLTREGKDPVTYMKAMLEKNKSLDGCAGFFYSMVTKRLEDEWLKNQLKRLQVKKERAEKEAWPYPEGKAGCLVCRGNGYWSKRKVDFNERDQEKFDQQRMDGYEVTMMVHPILDTKRVVFICTDCNPEGRIKDEHLDRSYTSYPIGGTPGRVPLDIE